LLFRLSAAAFFKGRYRWALYDGDLDHVFRPSRLHFPGVVQAHDAAYFLQFICPTDLD